MKGRCMRLFLAILYTPRGGRGVGGGERFTPPICFREEVEDKCVY
jgi:hypothetical protein